MGWLLIIWAIFAAWCVWAVWPEHRLVGHLFQVVGPNGPQGGYYRVTKVDRRRNTFDLDRPFDPADFASRDRTCSACGAVAPEGCKMECPGTFRL